MKLSDLKDYNVVSQGGAVPVQPEPVQAPKKDLLDTAASVANTIFPGTKEIGESLVKAGANVKNLATGGRAKYEAGLPQNTVDVPRLAEAYVGNAAQIGLAGAPATKAVAPLARIGIGAASGYASDVATKLAEGDSNPLMPGAGTVVGAAIPAAGSLVKLASGQAPRIINSLIKPLAKDFSYGSNPGRVVAELGITARDFDELGSKIGQHRERVGQEIGTLGAKLSTDPIIKLGDSLSPLDDAMRTAASQNNAPLLTRLQAVKRAVTHELEPVVGNDGTIGIAEKGERKLNGLTFQEARDVLRSVGDVTQFTGNPSDDKAVNAALKQVYGNIKGHTLTAADTLNPEAAKQFRKLTEQYGDLTSAKVATEYRDKIAQRSNMVGLNPTTAALGTGLITAISTGGAALPAVAVGLTAGALDKLASSPIFKTHLAAILSKKSDQEVRDIYKAIPALSRVLKLSAARITN